MIHQPLGGARGQATDIEIQAREIKKVKETIIDMITSSTGQKRDRVAADIERDFYLSAIEAKEYGLIDEVLLRGTKVGKKGT
jgi:ATP-dependent Clp protease protease subunit